MRFSPQHKEENSGSAISIDEETPADKVIDQTTATPETLLESEGHANEEDNDIKCNSQVLKKLMMEVSVFSLNFKAEL